MQITYFKIDSSDEISKVIKEYNDNMSDNIDCSFITIAQDRETVIAYTEIVNCSSKFSLLKSFKIRNEYLKNGIEQKMLSYVVWELQQKGISFLSIPNVMTNPDLNWIKDFKISNSGFIIAIM